jgi:hypothetical protein
VKVGNQAKRGNWGVQQVKVIVKVCGWVPKGLSHIKGCGWVLDGCHIKGCPTLRVADGC